MSLEDSITENLYPALFECFAIVLCGYVAGRMRLITNADAKGLGTFVGTFSLPSLIFISLAKLDFSSVNWHFLGAILLAKAIVFFLVIIITLSISRPINLGRAGLLAIFCTQSNDFAIGYPIISAIYKNSYPEFGSYLYLMAPISLIILNPIAFVLMEIGKQRQNAIPVEMRAKVECEWLKMSASILRGVIFNPIVAMTVLGMIGNIIFKQHLPVYIGGLLEILGNAFTASALFLLGLKMVGQFHKLRGPALLLPGALIVAKLIILPLLMRSCAGAILDKEANSTRALTEYAFLYGTIPAAPAVFVFSNQYKLDVDLMASSMVICTFLSAPLMLVSAEMIGLTKDYQPQIAHFETGVCAVSIAAAVWTLIVFACTKKYLKQPHGCTMFLILAQLFLAVAALVEIELEEKVVIALYFKLFFTYNTLLWVVCIAWTLYVAQRRGFEAVSKVSFFALPAVSLTSFFMTLLAYYTKPDYASIAIYLFTLIVTAVSLILLVRERRRRNSVSLSNLNSSEGAGLIDDDDSLEPNDYGALHGQTGSVGRQTSCDENGREGHLVMLLGYTSSVIISISYLCWRMMSSESSGVLIELEFVHVTLTYGQALLPFAIFALRPSCIYRPIALWTMRVWLKIRGERPEENLLPTANDMEPHTE